MIRPKFARLFRGINGIYNSNLLFAQKSLLKVLKANSETQLRHLGFREFKTILHNLSCTMRQCFHCAFIVLSLFSLSPLFLVFFIYFKLNFSRLVWGWAALLTEGNFSVNSIIIEFSLIFLFFLIVLCKFVVPC